MKTVKKTRDTFAVSLGGMNVITAFAAAPAIAHDRLRQDIAWHARYIPEQRWRLWMPRRFRVL